MTGNMATMPESRELAVSFPGFALELTSSQSFPEVSHSEFRLGGRLSGQSSEMGVLSGLPVPRTEPAVMGSFCGGALMTLIGMGST
jgi:hypothetical protein